MATQWKLRHSPHYRMPEGPQKFVRRALQLAKTGVAMFIRTGFIEDAGRYERLFRDRLPSCVAEFVERVSIFRGRVDPPRIDSHRLLLADMADRRGRADPARVDTAMPEALGEGGGL